MINPYKYIFIHFRDQHILGFKSFLTAVESQCSCTKTDCCLENRNMVNFVVGPHIKLSLVFQF